MEIVQKIEKMLDIPIYACKADKFPNYVLRTIIKKIRKNVYLHF